MNRREFLQFSGASVLSLSLIQYSLFASDKTTDLFYSIIEKAKDAQWHLMEINDIICHLALDFIGTPYKTKTLEKKKEQVVIDLINMDCFTFVDNVVGIAKCIKQQKYNFSDLIKQIEVTRYRDGKIIGYMSRLHYASDYLLDNIRRKNFTDISKALGGKEQYFNCSFMSKNPRFYPQLKDNELLIDEIKKIEQNLNSSLFYVILKDQIKKINSKIKDGNIIFVATNKKGLDYSHLGFAFDGKLLHASSKAKKIILSQSISKYINSVKSDTGISVVEVNE